MPKVATTCRSACCAANLSRNKILATKTINRVHVGFFITSLHVGNDIYGDPSWLILPSSPLEAEPCALNLQTGAPGGPVLEARRKTNFPYRLRPTTWHPLR